MQLHPLAGKVVELNLFVLPSAQIKPHRHCSACLPHPNPMRLQHIVTISHCNKIIKHPHCTLMNHVSSCFNHVDGETALGSGPAPGTAESLPSVASTRWHGRYQKDTVLVWVECLQYDTVECIHPPLLYRKHAELYLAGVGNHGFLMSQLAPACRTCRWDILTHLFAKRMKTSRRLPTPLQWIVLRNSDSH